MVYQGKYITKVSEESWEWNFISVFLALGRERQEDEEFEASLGYSVKSCLRKTRKKSHRRYFIIKVIISSQYIITKSLIYPTH